MLDLAFSGWNQNIVGANVAWLKPCPFKTAHDRGFQESPPPTAIGRAKAPSVAVGHFMVNLQHAADSRVPGEAFDLLQAAGLQLLA